MNIADEQNIRLQLRHKLDQIDKAFASSFLPDVLPMVTNCGSFIRDIPFPSFIIEVLFRLAKLFKGDYAKMEQHLNTIRLRIMTTVKESRKYLMNVPYSTESIVVEIMKVSHSNDYKARSLTLLLFGFLAPIIYENKKVHHLLIESLDCLEKSELIAAIYGCSEIGKYSRSFSSIIVDKIGELIVCHQADYQLKLHLLNALKNLEFNSEILTKKNNGKDKFNDDKVKKYYSALSSFALSDKCRENDAISLVTELTQMEPNFNRCLQNLYMSVLINICEKFPHLSSSVNLWVHGLLRNSHFLQKSSLSLFKLFIITQDEQCNVQDPCYSNHESFINVISKFNFNFWTVYQIARVALQCGKVHFALPLLEAIHRKCDSIETSSWLEALIYISRSQPIQFSLIELRKAENCLKDASLILKMLKSLNHGQEHHFSFGCEYVECLISTYRALKCTFISFNVSLNAVHQLSPAMISSFLTPVSGAFSKSSDQWTRLYSRSFDAGYQMLQQINMMIFINQLIMDLMRTLFDNEKFSFTPMNLKSLDYSNRKMSKHINKIFKDVYKSLNLLQEKASFQEKLVLIKRLLGSISTFSYDFPQYFFAKRWTTKIKLNLQPQSTDSDGILRVSSAELVPISVEGIIDTNNPNPISEVCVILTKNNSSYGEERKVVTLEGERYFKAQFVLKVNKTIKVQISLCYSDSNMKKVWYDNSDQEPTIIVTPIDA